ncbi:hypothetical protein D3C75_1099740 [compost metagenome]
MVAGSERGNHTGKGGTDLHIAHFFPGQLQGGLGRVTRCAMNIEFGTGNDITSTQGGETVELRLCQIECGLPVT